MITSEQGRAGRVPLRVAALLGDVPEKRIRRDLSESGLRRAGAKEGFTLHETLYFALSEHSPLGALPHRLRLDLWRALTSRERVAGSVRWKGTTLRIEGRVPATVEATSLVEVLTRRYAAWRRGLRRVEADTHTLGGALRFKGTRISVEHVGRLVNRGVPTAGLLDDFPALSEDDLVFAGLYVKLGRRPGRPRKKLKFRRSEG